MRKTIYLLSVICITPLLSLWAEEFLNLDHIAAQAKTATVELFPDSDSVLIDDFIQVKYQADGTSEEWDDTAIKILTEKGKRENRSLSLHFNTSYGTSAFKKVQLLKPDGSVIEIDIAAQSKIMVDPSQMNANIYNPNSKILTLSVPGLEIGDTLRHITLQKKTSTVVPDTWSSYQVFEYTTPILHTTYQVVAPSTRPLKNIALKSDLPNTVTFNKRKNKQDDTLIYTWEITNVPRMFKEPNMPKFYTVVQRLLVSTIDDWEYLSKWYWQLCLPRLEATTPEMETKANELIAGCTTTLEKIEALFNFVSQDIRYMGITTEEDAPGYEPHDVKTTFENRYGVCRDKAALLVAMLRIVDIKAFPVLIMSGPKKDREVPQPFFNHAVTAALGDDGEYILMDSTDENTKDIFPSYLQDMSYLVARPDGETLRTSPIIPVKKNMSIITTHASLDQSGTLTAESNVRFEGINDTAFRGYFAKLKPEELKRFFEGKIKAAVPSAELQTLEVLPAELRDTTQPLTAKLTYTAKNLLIEGDDKKLLNLPQLGRGLGYVNFLIGQTGLEERKYPLHNGLTAGILETLELTLPKESGTLNIPNYQTIETPQITWDTHVAQTNETLLATNTFLVKTVEFSPKEYLVLKQNLKDIEYNRRKKLILNSPPALAPISDVRILEKTTQITLDDSSHWIETTRTKLKILTYAGTKKHAEIKLSYNPAWQTIKLTHATVTQPDGTTKEISPEELNIMDASWVSSAPRYPAEKILVATLPGVKIGSILDYEIVSTVAGKPFFSTIQIFNGHETIDSKTFTLTAPESMPLTLRNTGITETKTASDTTITYTWQAKNQPPVKKEEALPSWWTFNPAVFISTGTWKTHATEIHSHLKKATKQQDQTAKLARELTQNISGDGEKAIVLRDWVAKNLRAAGPGLNSLPLSAITPADQTLNERYGNNPDRMVVLHALLKAAKLKPEFVLSGGISLIPEVAEPLLAIPSRSAFGTVLIKLRIDGKTLYLDGASQYAQLGTSTYHHRPLLDLKTGILGTVEVAPEMDAQNHATIKMNIAANGETDITQSSRRQGTAFTAFHRQFAEITPENRRRLHLELISGISQSAQAASELTTHFGSYPGKIEFSVTAERYAVQDGEYLYFTIPGGGLNTLLHYRSNTRENPLAWNSHTDTILEYKIVLPDGYEPVILPKNYSWQAPSKAGQIEETIQYNPHANTIEIKQTATLHPALIPAKQFPSIIEAARTLAHPDTRTILLQKKPKQK